MEVESKENQQTPEETIPDSAIFGAVAVGITVPTILECWNCGQQGVFSKVITIPESKTLGTLAGEWLGLALGAAVTCSPGGIFFSLIVFSICKKTAEKIGNRLEDTIAMGIGCCFLTAILNFPILIFGANILKMNESKWMYLALLVVASGASSGAWIAWQAWRSVHPEENFWPRFSLGTLVIVVLAWGALLAVFAPK